MTLPFSNGPKSISAENLHLKADLRWQPQQQQQKQQQQQASKQATLEYDIDALVREIPLMTALVAKILWQQNKTRQCNRPQNCLLTIFLGVPSDMHIEQEAFKDQIGAWKKQASTVSMFASETCFGLNESDYDFTLMTCHLQKQKVKSPEHVFEDYSSIQCIQAESNFELSNTLQVYLFFIYFTAVPVCVSDNTVQKDKVHKAELCDRRLQIKVNNMLPTCPLEILCMAHPSQVIDNLLISRHFDTISAINRQFNQGSDILLEGNKDFNDIYAVISVILSLALTQRAAGKSAEVVMRRFCRAKNNLRFPSSVRFPSSHRVTSKIMYSTFSFLLMECADLCDLLKLPESCKGAPSIPQDLPAWQAVFICSYITPHTGILIFHVNYNYCIYTQSSHDIHRNVVDVPVQ